jgi:hypothetical protein
MRQGIYLGRPPARSSRAVSIALVAAAAAALGLAVLYQRTRSQVDALASEVQGLERALEPSASDPASGGERFVAERLRLVLGSGAADAVPPTELLRLVESALPDETVLGRLSYSATPEPTLTLEATTVGGDRVTEMERRLQASPSVATTSLLEERRLADGRLGVRIRVGLAGR